MAKLVKNNFGNLWVICFVFLVVTVWIFSGWPQIWQEPPIPSEVEEAKAATERQSPDGLLQQDNLSGAVTDIDEDPDSSTGDWLTYITAGTNTVARVSFPTPTSNPNVGADLQEFRVLVRRASVGVGKTPTVRIELYENNVSKGIILAATDVTTDDPGVVLSVPWDATLLGTADGSIVECYIYGTASIAGGNKSMIEVGAVEWNVDYTPTFTFSVDSPTKSLGPIDPGTPVTADTTLSITSGSANGVTIKAVRTDADTTMDLQTDAAVNITDKDDWVSATPNSAAWSGTGLGFRVKETGTETNYWSETWWGLDAGTPLFAGFPAAAETISTYSGSTAGEFYIIVQYKLDVLKSQKTGTYAGGVTYTAIEN